MTLTALESRNWPPQVPRYGSAWEGSSVGSEVYAALALGQYGGERWDLAPAGGLAGDHPRLALPELEQPHHSDGLSTTLQVWIP